MFRKTESPDYFCIYKNYERKIAQVELNRAEKNYWLITRLFVPPDYRNQGLASRFMEDILEWADRKRFILTTEIHSPDGIQEEKLIEILQRYGFEKKTGSLPENLFWKGWFNAN